MSGGKGPRDWVHTQSEWDLSSLFSPLHASSPSVTMSKLFHVSGLQCPHLLNSKNKSPVTADCSTEDWPGASHMWGKCLTTDRCTVLTLFTFCLGGGVLSFTHSTGWSGTWDSPASAFQTAPITDLCHQFWPFFGYVPVWAKAHSLGRPQAPIHPHSHSFERQFFVLFPQPVSYPLSL